MALERSASRPPAGFTAALPVCRICASAAIPSLIPWPCHGPHVFPPRFCLTRLLENPRRVVSRGGAMPARFPNLSRFVVKILEVAGAGLASAIAGFLLGHMGPPPAPPAPTVVRFVV